MTNRSAERRLEQRFLIVDQPGCGDGRAHATMMVMRLMFVLMIPGRTGGCLGGATVDCRSILTGAGQRFRLARSVGIPTGDENRAVAVGARARFRHRHRFADLATRIPDFVARDIPSLCPSEA